MSRPLLAVVLAAAAFLGGLLGGVLAPARSRAAPPATEDPERQDPAEPADEAPADPERSTAEWVSLALSVLLVAGLVGAVVYLHLSQGTGPAVLEVRALVEDTREVDGRFYLPIEVRNPGGAAAEQIRLRVDGDGESADLDLDRLASGATSRVTAVLAGDPRRSQPRVEVVGFLEP